MGGGRGIACEGIEYLFSMLFLFGEVLYLCFISRLRMTLFDWSSSRSGMKMLTTVGLTLAHDVKGTLIVLFVTCFIPILRII